jgi:penicillin-binding protein 1A
MGGYAQGGRISAPIFKQWAQIAFKDAPKVPFAAPAGIRWAPVDRASGKLVYGVFPTTSDPMASVIWEAFQPQTEPRKSLRAAIGDPYNPQQPPQPAQAQQPTRRTAAPGHAPAAAPVTAPAQPQPNSLPTQNTL